MGAIKQINVRVGFSLSEQFQKIDVGYDVLVDVDEGENEDDVREITRSKWQKLAYRDALRALDLVLGQKAARQEAAIEAVKTAQAAASTAQAAPKRGFYR